MCKPRLLLNWDGLVFCCCFFTLDLRWIAINYCVEQKIYDLSQFRTWGARASCSWLPHFCVNRRTKTNRDTMTQIISQFCVWYFYSHNKKNLSLPWYIALCCRFGKGLVVLSGWWNRWNTTEELSLYVMSPLHQINLSQFVLEHLASCLCFCRSFWGVWVRFMN